ncbi:MAG: helveticin J family class III bacteriocin, partial [Lachnospiraceae bacterium]|nr:helveticin J family class III bacteriocin [Lachnospiraceae bacterium]
MEWRKQKRAIRFLFCCLLVGLLFSGFGYQKVQAEDGLDTHGDDPVAGMLDKDDFETTEEWEDYQEDYNKIHPRFSVRGSVKLTPAYSPQISAKLCYTITGLPVAKAIQNWVVSGNYLYVTQRKSSDTYLSRCKINTATKTAVFQDKMILENFGHGQTLEEYQYNGKTYLLVSCKANTAYTDNYWSMQI